MGEIPHSEHVDYDHKAYGKSRNDFPVPFLSLVLWEISPPQNSERQGDKDKGRKGILSENHHAVGHKCGDDFFLHLGIRRSGERTRDSGEEPAQEAEAARNGKSDESLLLELLLVIILLYDPVQHKEPEYR